MKITFHGAAGGVTGSCTVIEHKNKKIMVDCGAFQGQREELIKNPTPFLFDPKEIDLVLLTHAHFDHCGRLPKLVAQGYEGPIYMTAATKDLIELVLEDSLNVMDIEYENLGVLPFFRQEHLEAMLKQVQTVRYEEENAIDDISFTFFDAGHIFGSSTIQLRVGGKNFVFSGDIGNEDAPIIEDTYFPKSADIAVMETTYAMVEHDPPKLRQEKLIQAVDQIRKTNGVLLIPAFAIERTQELLWEIHELTDEGKLPKDVDIYLDSPLAINVTHVFGRYPKLYDQKADEEHRRGHDFLNLPNLTQTISSGDSRKINSAPNPKIIIAGSGMMNGGRMIFHLERYLPLETTILFVVGYQAEGTLGRQIIEKAETVKIKGHDIPVHAQIWQIDSYSAHADNSRLIDWLESINPKPVKVFLNHGEKERTEKFSKKLKDKGFEPIVPEYGESYEI